MEKRYNFRIYPSKMQEEQINRNIDCARFVYNYYLAERIEAYNEGKGILSLNECCRDLTVLKKTEGYTWLRAADDNSLRDSIRSLDLAFKAFFRNTKKKGAAPGFPRFKSKKDTYKSYKSKNNCQRRSVDISEKGIKLPKLGWVNCRVSKKVEGRILSATVLKVASGKYYVSVNCTEVECASLPKTGAVIGLHMGIRDLAVSSDGECFENRRYYEKSLKRISRLQKEVSRKPSDSNNHEKARIKLAKMYEKISNQKTDALQKMTTQIVRDYDVICIRDVDLKATAKDSRFSRVMMDAGWGAFIKQLSYKCEWYGKELIKIDRFYPCTRICSVCGHYHKELREKYYLKEWDCPKCKAHHNRSVNAAVNILNEGLKITAVAI